MGRDIYLMRVKSGVAHVVGDGGRRSGSDQVELVIKREKERQPEKKRKKKIPVVPQEKFSPVWQLGCQGPVRNIKIPPLIRPPLGPSVVNVMMREGCYYHQTRRSPTTPPRPRTNAIEKKEAECRVCLVFQSEYVSYPAVRTVYI